MLQFNEKTKEELNQLVEIGRKYRENVLSDSLLSDVLKSLKNKPETMEMAREFLRDQGIEVVQSLFDVEESDNDSDEDTNYEIQPYDPSLIDISPKILSLDIILNRIENDEMGLMPDFQRKSGLWDTKQKSLLIESLILRIPMPAFYFDGSDDECWMVIDGLQRLTALKEFFIDKTLKLTGLEFIKDISGLGYEEIPKVYIRRMKETQIICYIINPGAPVNLKYNIFKRINTGGLHLEAQEIRHALYQGYATTYIKKLADSDAFKQSTGYSIPKDRMLDREFVLRFIAFFEQGVESYDGSIDEFLNTAMVILNRKYDREPEYADEVEKKFNLVLDKSYQIFGRFAFRRMPDMVKRRTISKALFETWTSILAKLSEDKLDLLVKNKDCLLQKYIPMFTQDDEFFNSIRSGKVSSVKKRFEKIEGLVEGVLNNA